MAVSNIDEMIINEKIYIRTAIPFIANLLPHTAVS